MSRLTKHQLLTLAVLLRYPMHPYLIRQEVIELTGHQVWTSGSAMSKTLDSLFRAGYIEECRSVSSYWLKRRRGAPYELTLAGYKVTRRELSLYFEVVVKSRPWLEKFDERLVNM